MRTTARAALLAACLCFAPAASATAAAPPAPEACCVPGAKCCSKCDCSGKGCACEGDKARCCGDCPCAKGCRCGKEKKKAAKNTDCDCCNKCPCGDPCPCRKTAKPCCSACTCVAAHRAQGAPVRELTARDGPGSEGLIDLRQVVAVKVELPDELRDSALRATFLFGAVAGILALLAGHFIFGHRAR